VKTVAFYTLGCKVNQYETAALASLFTRRGYRVVDFNNVADVYVVNTCTVTETADRKSRQMIRRAARQNPKAVVVVTGCYAQLQPAVVASIPGVDVIIGTTGRERLVQMAEEAMETGRQVLSVRGFSERCDFEEMPALFNTRTRAFLKIQEGCCAFCTYCLVPYTRGPLRSRKPGAVLEEARGLLAAGFKEIVLTGINIGYYGADFTPPVRLEQIIPQILELPGLLRLRLSSIEPEHVTTEIIRLLVTEPRFCPHLHVPLQSGDDGILKLMGRRYTVANYRALVGRLREEVRDVAISTDVMVGFPGETEEAFEATSSFVRETGFSGLHLFKFSPRPGTPAARFPGQVPGGEKERRLKLLLAVGQELRAAFAASFLGRTVQVLVETKNPDGSWEGLSEHYLPVVFYAEENCAGAALFVKVEAVRNDTLCGRLLKKELH